MRLHLKNALIAVDLETPHTGGAMSSEAEACAASSIGAYPVYQASSIGATKAAITIPRRQSQALQVLRPRFYVLRGWAPRAGRYLIRSRVVARRGPLRQVRG
jgi:hypothetical protein